ncbi:MAG: DNA adenine methylase [Vicinamibacterales bacterium]
MTGSLPPPLKWAGGKRWQVPLLAPLWRQNAWRRLVEPFCGGLAVTLGLLPERALLNDANRHLIAFYRQLKRGLKISVRMANDEQFYYKQRERFNRLLEQGREETPLAASLFYYLNRTCYNGLCRFNGSGRFNVPFGSYKRIRYVRDFSAYRAAFRNWEFSDGDFSQVPLAPDDFVYADPPYDVEFRQYSQGGFDWEDQVRTAEWLVHHPGPVVLVNQATERIVELYSGLGYSIEYVAGPRRISCTGDRGFALEVVATRNTGRAPFRRACAGAETEPVRC